MRAGMGRRRVTTQAGLGGNQVLPRAHRRSRTAGWGVAALVSAALWLVIARLAWWGLHD
jgi:hypothetical protein